MKMGPPRAAVKPKRCLMQKDHYLRRFNDNYRKTPVWRASLEDHVQNACLTTSTRSIQLERAISDIGTAIVNVILAECGSGVLRGRNQYGAALRGL